MIINNDLNAEKEELAAQMDMKDKMERCAMVLNCQPVEVPNQLQMLHAMVFQCNQILNPQTEH